MKSLILVLATILSISNTILASNIGDGALAIVKTDKVEISLESEGQKEFILASVFNVENDNVDMTFNSDVSMVQIFNSEGELEMMFPIGSSKVSFGMSLFENGHYKMGFVIEGVEDIQFTSLTIK